MKIATIIGARPQFIKAATVSRAIAGIESAISETIIHTGQHFDGNMSQVFFDELGIPEPDYHLGVSGGGHGAMTGAMLEKLETLLLKIRPDWVLVYGDTNSTLAGALAAVKLHIPVAHVEAGLRSYNRRMPEEINRIVTDQLSSVLFCPTETAVRNLKSEGFPHRLTTFIRDKENCSQEKEAESQQRIINSGDVMFDAALFYAKKANGQSKVLIENGLEHRQYVLATVHRAENTDDPFRLRSIMDGLDTLSKQIPVILPLHPRTRAALVREEIKPQGIRLIEPVGYLDMVALEAGAAVIATDSGGVQKEAYFHGVPCVTLRDETEWVELVESGWNRLVPPGKADIGPAILAAVGSKGQSVRPYGEGRAAEEIVNTMVQN
jgi:UDP-GlcNAc3NAcA epimerase